jgi:hypothetical protein
MTRGLEEGNGARVGGYNESDASHGTKVCTGRLGRVGAMKRSLVLAGIGAGGSIGYRAGVMEDAIKRSLSGAPVALLCKGTGKKPASQAWGGRVKYDSRAGG